MEKYFVLEIIKETEQIIKALPQETNADRAVNAVIGELLSFCEEATSRIDNANKRRLPMRVEVLIALISDLKKDAKLIDTLLGFDPSYEEVRVSLAEGIGAFESFAQSQLRDAVVLAPGDLSVTH